MMASKTKIGVVLIGAGAVLGTVGGMLTGSIDIAIGITALLTEVGAVLAVFGIRDWPIINKIK